MRATIALTAVASALLTLAAVRLAGWAPVTTKVKLENARVRVIESVSPPGAARERYTRAAGQVIVFLDDCRYERTDSTSGEKTVRERKSGDVIWHDQGEDAPVLKNVGQSPYRTLTIELK